VCFLVQNLDNLRSSVSKKVVGFISSIEVALQRKNDVCDQSLEA
jgi:hypothetical protein